MRQGLGTGDQIIAPKFGKPLPGIMWDGIVNAKDPDPHICIANNGETQFLNYKKVSTDLKSHVCTLPSLTAIEIASLGTH